MLVDVSARIDAYYENHPDLSNEAKRVSFGTSGGLRKTVSMKTISWPRQDICEREIVEYARLMQQLGVPAVAGTTIPY